MNNRQNDFNVWSAGGNYPGPEVPETSPSAANPNPSPPMDFSKLKDILESVSKVGRLSIATVDQHGNVLTKPSGVGGFCRQAELNPLTYHCCLRSHEFGLSQALARGEPFSHFCPFGFLETTVPLTHGHLTDGPQIDGPLTLGVRPWAAATFGQIRCDNAPPGLVDLAKSMAPEVGEALKDPILKAFHEAVPTRDFHELDALAALLVNLCGWHPVPSPNPCDLPGQAPSPVLSALPGQAASPVLSTRPGQVGYPGSTVFAGESGTVYHSESKSRDGEDSPSNGQPHQSHPVEGRLGPAFLIDSISSLANLAVLEGAWKTNRMAVLLADHLKSALFGPPKDFKPLAEELADAERYLSLQGLRYGESLAFKLDVPADLLDFRVPTDSLLAPAERAVRFGLATGQGDLEVSISARRQGQELALEVRDNLTTVRSAWEEPLGSPFHAPSETLGLTHRLEAVKARLEGRFPKSSELSVVPDPQGGSSYRARLPLNRFADS